MNTLPKDMVGKLIDELSPQDFISFCSSNVDANVTRICNMDEIWERRLKRDFSKVVERFPNSLKSSKKTYLYLFRRLSEMAEHFTEVVLSRYVKVRKFLSLEFNKILYNFFYDLSLETLITGMEENGYDEITDWISFTVDNILRHDDVIDFAIDYFPGGGFDQEESELYHYWRSKIGNPLKKSIKEIIDFLKKY